MGGEERRTDTKAIQRRANINVQLLVNLISARKQASNKATNKCTFEPDLMSLPRQPIIHMFRICDHRYLTRTYGVSDA